MVLALAPAGLWRRHSPLRVVWGAKSRSADELPPHARAETWEDVGHVVVWDAPERLAAACPDL